ncbi:MAG: hypothetical protein K2L79_00510, partial [Bacteroidales bacterium]|nr:hypothetical protein [Bacteroidales bacterium]
RNEQVESSNLLRGSQNPVRIGRIFCYIRMKMRARCTFLKLGILLGGMRSVGGRASGRGAVPPADKAVFTF